MLVETRVGDLPVTLTGRDGGLEPAGLFDRFGLARTGMVLVGRDDGRVRSVSPAAREIVGCGEADYVGRRWSEIVHPVHADGAVGADGIAADLAGSGDTPQIVRIARPDGTAVQALLSTVEVTVDGDRCLLARFEDVSELASTHRQLRLVLGHTPFSIFRIDHDGQVPLSGGSDSAEPAVALHQEARSAVRAAFHDQPTVLALVRRAMHGEQAHQVVKSGGRWYDLHLVPVPEAEGGPASVAGIVSDVTAHERATAELVRRTACDTALADLAQQALRIADEDTLWDVGVRTLTQQLGADLVTVRHDADIDADTDTDADADGAVDVRPVDAEAADMAVPVTHAGRRIGTVLVRRRTNPLTPDNEAFVRSVAAILGAAAMRIRMEDGARYLSLHDPLTGLPNRAALLDHLGRSLRRAAHDGRHTGVLFIDLDGFKAINDTLGHKCGDELLRVVASRLRDAVRPGDVVGRLAGDEFAVLCDDIGDLDELRAIGERVIATALTPPIELIRPVGVSGSVGLARSGADLTDAEDLLNAADMAMYEAKRRGPGHVFAYDDRIRAALATRLRDSTDLRRALGAGELTLCFEPVVSQSGVIVAAEAVPYWAHPTRGLLGPDDLYPIAFNAGLTVAVDRWLVDSVAAVLPTAAPRQQPDRQEELTRRELWLRISERGLSDTSLRRTIISRAACLSGVGGIQASLGILVPDTLSVPGDRTLDTITAELSGAGMAVWVDLSEIRPLRSTTRDTIPPGIDGVRLGSQNIHGAEHDAMAEAVIAGLVRFSHLLHLGVAARGVDTLLQLAAVRGAGCDLMQGVAVGKALPEPPWSGSARTTGCGPRTEASTGNSP
ncbi:PAS domain S-box-containing protein/diguanylate cyclase (GGDEF) domain-containing protein [Parafrankia irregularis]|uniref:PAS domain S-box-containing protein/diguanylate cyclase (GGDEF) domain-containing protein n=1 Tax=Parafrankia irregularis TaxID=795642 RepID=A0A0S4QW05_9ACTN|nr:MULTISPECIES: diguanylate cyclase [Parafrankia]MBE3203705.1 diguanylate cyclase [Parafrankia sp. CH37]CUU59052.1 PAS domain S-box-containing protein/diguanylate cyclase (GGDEF) domain-containing protein [Parafrankia irregularis]